MGDDKDEEEAIEVRGCSKSCVCLGDETEVKSRGERGEEKGFTRSASRGQLRSSNRLINLIPTSLSPGQAGRGFFWSHFTNNRLLRQNSGLSPSQRERTGFCQRFSRSAIVRPIFRRPI